MNPAIILGVAAAAGLAWAVKAHAKQPDAPEDDSANYDVNVRKAQEYLNKLTNEINRKASERGAMAGIRPLTVDGKFGPNTADAWGAAAERLGLPPITLGSVGAATVRVNDRAAMGISAAAAAVMADTPKPKPKPAPKPPQPAPKPKPKPAPAPDLTTDEKEAIEAAKKVKRLEDAGKPDPKPPAPTPPKPGVPPRPTATVSTLDVQNILRQLGGKITADGKYGPNTQKLWAAAAKNRGIDGASKKGATIQQTVVFKATFDRLKKDGHEKALAAADKKQPEPERNIITTREAGQPRHELINNAITDLDFRTPPTPTGTKKSVTDLFNNWHDEWWDKGKRGEDPAKLDRYALWYTRAWRMLTPDLQSKVPHPRTIDPAFKETPKPQPAAGAELATIPVLRAQELLNKHGAGVQADGKYGPITLGAWQKLASDNKVTAKFERLDGTTVRVDAEALRKLEALPASHKAAPPAGYDRAKAKARAKDVSAHLKKQGRAYDHKILSVWQTQAGIGADGLYGPHSRNALVYYGATDAPAPFSKGTEKPYVPPA